MSNYRNISLTFWEDSKVDDEFTPEDKYFYLYLLTNPHTNICGCYEISMKQMERETGYNKDTIMRLIQRMDNIHDVVKYSEDTKEILVLNWHKYNWSISENTIKAVKNVGSFIKNDIFKDYVFSTLQLYTDNRKQKTDTVTETDTETDTDTDTDASMPLARGLVGASKTKKSVVYFPEDEVLNSAFVDYVKMRKQIKAPMTDRAIELAIKKLENLSGGDNDKAVAILEQSIMNSWKGLFDLTKPSTQQKSMSTFDAIMNA